MSMIEIKDVGMYYGIDTTAFENIFFVNVKSILKTAHAINISTIGFHRADGGNVFWIGTYLLDFASSEDQLQAVMERISYFNMIMFKTKADAEKFAEEISPVLIMSAMTMDNDIGEKIKHYNKKIQLRKSALI